MRRASCGTSAMPAKTTTAKTAGAKKTTPKKAMAKKAMAKKAMSKKAISMARLRHQLAGASPRILKEILKEIMKKIPLLRILKEWGDQESLYLAEEIEALDLRGARPSRRSTFEALAISSNLGP